jgi:phage terminase small subunit
MPRKSAAALAVASVHVPRTHPAPPPDLSAGGLAIWRELMTCVPAGHFVDSDRALIASFCEACHAAATASRALAAEGFVVAGRASPWLVVQEKAQRAQATLALRLRLCPSARIDARAADRNAQRVTYPTAVDWAKDE